ncbi:MAG: SPW repeat domain-containing protein [bacterium]
MTHPHAGHDMEAPAQDQRPAEVTESLRRLDAMRAQQSLLDELGEREMAEQRRHDAHAQRLMETDPAGHIEMMRPMQEAMARVRDLPEDLLEREAALFADLAARDSEPAIEPLKVPLMTDMVLSEKWAHIAAAFLGAWLIASPSTLAYPSTALAWSDIVSGILIVVLAALSYREIPWAPWANATVGLWVMFAPLVFWAPDAASYANDTLAGVLVVSLTVIIPMRMKMPGAAVPPGWSYNPSTWVQRAPIIVIGVVSYFMTRYMSAFQLGHIATVWDPFFGEGTARILTSDVSRMFPISDAGLGAYVYMIEILSTVMGDSRRWRTMPWMVAMFGIAVIPLGITSVVLIILQPLAVGAWCTLCLISAVLMLVMVALSLDEVIAMIQFLMIGTRAGQSAWTLFWNGGTTAESLRDVGLARPRGSPWRDMWSGLDVPWTLLVSTLVGVWIVAAPDIFNSRGGAADSDHLLGALVVLVAVTAMAEVARTLRFLNILLALAIIAAPWVLGGAPFAGRLSDLIAGALLILLSLPRGAIRGRYGSWNPFIV